jgi:hypothetical protein
MFDQCLPMPVPGDFGPDCEVLAARFRKSTGTSATTVTSIAICNRCAEPGLAAPPPANQVANVSSELAQYDCVCEVEGLRNCSQTSSPVASWCYEDEDAGGDSSCAEAWLGLNAPMGLIADLYIACFD